MIITDCYSRINFSLRPPDRCQQEEENASVRVCSHLKLHDHNSSWSLTNVTTSFIGIVMTTSPEVRSLPAPQDPETGGVSWARSPVMRVEHCERISNSARGHSRRRLRTISP
jgi:hypothetical protein